MSFLVEVIVTASNRQHNKWIPVGYPQVRRAGCVEGCASVRKGILAWWGQPSVFTFIKNVKQIFGSVHWKQYGNVCGFFFF